MKHIGIALIAFAGCLAGADCAPAPADRANDEASKTMPVPPAPVSPTGMTAGRGEVVKVDRETGTITVRHGPIPNLQLSAGSTPFQVQDRTLLRQVKQGDSISFRVSNANGLITMIEVERPK